MQLFNQIWTFLSLAWVSHKIELQVLQTFRISYSQKPPLKPWVQPPYIPNFEPWKKHHHYPGANFVSRKRKKNADKKKREIWFWCSKLDVHAENLKIRSEDTHQILHHLPLPLPLQEELGKKWWIKFLKPGCWVLEVRNSKQGFSSLIAIVLA